MRGKSYALLLLDEQGATEYVAVWNTMGQFSLRYDDMVEIVTLNEVQSRELAEYLADMGVRQPEPTPQPAPQAAPVVPVKQQRQIIPRAIADAIEDALIELLTKIAVDRSNGHVEHEQYMAQRRRAVEAQNWLRMQSIRDA